MAERTVHHGRNIKRIREIQGIKQEALALELGEDWNQKKISLLESKETVDDGLLEQVAKALKTSPEVIKNFDEDAAISVIGNSYYDHSSSNVNYQCAFNPIEKIVQLYDEKMELYERMLKDKDSMIERLEMLLQEKR